jgi:hypothetical protein
VDHAALPSYIPMSKKKKSSWSDPQIPDIKIPEFKDFNIKIKEPNIPDPEKFAESLNKVSVGIVKITVKLLELIGKLIMKYIDKRREEELSKADLILDNHLDSKPIIMVKNGELDQLEAKYL